MACTSAWNTAVCRSVLKLNICRVPWPYTAAPLPYLPALNQRNSYLRLNTVIQWLWLGTELETSSCMTKTCSVFTPASSKLLTCSLSMYVKQQSTEHRSTQNRNKHAECVCAGNTQEHYRGMVVTATEHSQVHPPSCSTDSDIQTADKFTDRPTATEVSENKRRNSEVND
jgi:hypothetical protein